MPALWIARDRAIEELGPPRLAVLRECVEGGWHMFEDHVQQVLPLCSPVGQANILHECVTEQARQRLRPEHGFRIRDMTEEAGRFLVTVDGTMTLQFRKLTRDLQTRNNETPTSRAFDHQEPQIEGIPDYPRLTVGYQLSQYRDSLSEVYLVFAVGKTVRWHHDLRSGEHSLELDLTTRRGPSPADQEAEERHRSHANRTQLGGGEVTAE